MPYGRYYVPILPVVVVLGIASVIDIPSVTWLKRFSLVCLGAVLVMQAALIPVMFWNIPERVPISVAMGAESQETFLTRALPMYQAVQYLNRNCLPGAKVLGVGVEQIRFYLKNPLFTPYDVGPYLKGPTMQEMAAGFAENNFAFLMVYKRSRQMELTTPYADQAFLSQYAVLEYAVSETYVYRLKETAGQLAVETNRLTNPSFELKNESGMPAAWIVYGRPPRVVEDSTRAHTGKIALVAGHDGGLLSRMRVEGNKLYSVGNWSRADLPDQVGRVQINWLDANQQTIDASIEVFQAEPKWAWHQLSASAPSNASFADVYVSVQGNSEIFFDDYVFVPGQLPAPK